MLEPRKHSHWAARPRLKFLGGVAEFDLWWRDDQSAPGIPSGDILPYLRLVTIDMPSVDDWDELRVPLHLNEETNSSMEPAMRRLKGRWGCINLTLAQLAEIRTYLQCFAPWVLGGRLTDGQQT
jgi:hypothetical protein